MQNKTLKHYWCFVSESYFQYIRVSFWWNLRKMKWDVAKSACQLTPLFPKLSNRVFWIAQTQGREENQSQQAQNELIFIAMNEFGCQIHSWNKKVFFLVPSIPVLAIHLFPLLNFTALYWILFWFLFFIEFVFLIFRALFAREQCINPIFAINNCKHHWFSLRPSSSQRSALPLTGSIFKGTVSTLGS